MQINGDLLDGLISLGFAGRVLAKKFNHEMSLVFKACYDALLQKHDLNGKCKSFKFKVVGLL